MKILHALLFTIAPIPFYHFSCAKRLSCVCLWSSFFIMSLPCNAPPYCVKGFFPIRSRFFNLTVLNEIRAKGCIPEKDWSILSKSSYRKSPPPVKRVVRDAGYKPALLAFLIPDILLYRRIIQAYRADIILFGPKVPISKLIFQIRMSVKHHE